MGQKTELDSLTSKHRGLQEEIDAENRRPYPDDFKIQGLKRQKLKLKDRIAALSAQSVAVAA